jgi:hypothetical protein
VLKLRPLHNWASHPADAFRYLALGLRDGQRGDWSKPIQPLVGTIA